MADVTPIYGFPFQELGDSPDGASLGEDLALAVEGKFVDVDADLAAANTTQHAYLRHTLGSTFSTGSETPVPWDVTSDMLGFSYDTDPANRWLVAQLAGSYLVSASVRWDAASGGTGRVIRIRHNGALVAEDFGLPGTRSVSVVIPLKLAVGDTVQVPLFQDSGNSLAISTFSYDNRFDIARVGG